MHRVRACSRFVAWCAALGALGIGRAWAQDLKPTDTDRRVTRDVLEILQRQHVPALPFDRELASQVLDGYVKMLDPNKQYFLQSDIEEFNKRKARLAEDLKEGDIAIAFDVHRRYRQRVAEVEKIWKELLGPRADFDFTTKESVVLDEKVRQYPRSEQERREQWRLWLQYDLLSMKTAPEAKDLNLADLREELAASYARFARAVRLTKSQQILEWFLRRIGACYDREAAYTSSATLAEYEADRKKSFFGIGIVWREDGRIGSLIAGGPAEKDGRLKPKDRIVSVGQDESGEMIDITRLTQREATALVRGMAGTTVRIGYVKPGEKNQRTLSLRRGAVSAPASKVDAQMLDVKGHKVGYLAVPDLYRDDSANESTTLDVRKQMERFSTQGVDVVVLDLRRCGGGILSESIALGGLFLGEGPMLQIKRQTGAVQTSSSRPRTLAWVRPLVVLTGHSTAGGAEVVSAAIQDYKRGVLIGDERTAGRGAIRGQLKVAGGQGYLRVTTAVLHRVTGETLYERGVKPDVLLPSLSSVGALPPAERNARPAPDRVKAIAVPSHDMVSTEILQTLRAQSDSRARASVELTKLRRLIEWEIAQNARAVETLNEKDYRDKLKAAQAIDLPESNPGVFDYYLKEVCAIAADYATAVGSKTARIAVIDKESSSEDPALVRQRELARQRVVARQMVQQLEEEARVLNNKVAAARLSLVVVQKVCEDAKAGSEQKSIAEEACVAAQRTLTERMADLARTQSKLKAARSRYEGTRE